MADETRKEDTSGSPHGEAESGRPTPATSARPRRPYTPPKLRSLGKVSDLTFGAASGSQPDGSKLKPQKPGTSH
jgi:hypothetical protein